MSPNWSRHIDVLGQVETDSGGELIQALSQQLLQVAAVGMLGMSPEGIKGHMTKGGSRRYRRS